MNKAKELILVTLPGGGGMVQLEYIKAVTKAPQGYTLHMSGLPDFPLTVSEGMRFIELLKGYQGDHVISIGDSDG